MLSLDQPGKGNAIRTGMLRARGGEFRFMADVDLSMPIEELRKFLPPEHADPQVAIASREQPGSQRIGEPFYRHLIGRVFNLLVRILVLPGIQDTQCGFKCFSAEAAEAILALRRWTVGALTLKPSQLPEIWVIASQKYRSPGITNPAQGCIS